MSSALDDILPEDLRARVRAFDATVDELFDRLRGNPVADRLFYSASELGDFSVIWHLLGAAQALAARDPRVLIRLSAALGVESLLVNGVIKSAFKRTRPEAEEERPRYLRQPKTSSFPSGHASSALMAATMLSKRDPQLRVVWYAVAAIVASSRIYVRIHHGSDVAAGAVLGRALGLLANRIAPLP